MRAEKSIARNFCKRNKKFPVKAASSGLRLVSNKEINVSKQTFVAFGVASAIAFATLSISLPASAQMGRGGGYGPGMMDGQGYVPGMMGPGYGPGMMGNFPGMMGGCSIMGTTTDGKVSTFAEGRIAFLKAELGHY